MPTVALQRCKDWLSAGTHGTQLPPKDKNRLRHLCLHQDQCLVPLPGYVDIGIIPVGAREIRIEEVAEAGNFLALRSEDPEKYFLNGGWTIQWNGDYRVAGTTFTYKRTGNWENLTSPGPTVEPVWIQVGWIPLSLWG